MENLMSILRSERKIINLNKSAVRNYLFVILSLFAFSGIAQNKIKGYQYWFDSQYSNAVTQSITPAQSYTLSTQINTSSLLKGLHRFTIKFIDDSIRESSAISSFFYKPDPASALGN